MQRIMSVSTVDVHILKSNPTKLDISATGQVPTSGWSNPILTPWYYIAPPSDGIQDFDFVATAPTGIVSEVIKPIAVELVVDIDPTDYWGKGKALKGIRVHSRTNNVEAAVGTATVPFADGDRWVPYPWRGVEEKIEVAQLMQAPIGSLIGRHVRVYHTGDPLTMDLQRDRINIELDEANDVVAIWLG